MIFTRKIRNYFGGADHELAGAYITCEGFQLCCQDDAGRGEFVCWKIGDFEPDVLNSCGAGISVTNEQVQTVVARIENERFRISRLSHASGGQFVRRGSC